MSLEQVELGRLRLLSSERLIGSAVSFVRALAEAEGMAAADLPRLELALEEACLNVVKHAYPDESRAYYDVIVEERPGSLVVAVQDQGLPFNLVQPEAGTGLTLMRAFADRVHFLNLGRDGKRVELVKRLPYRDLESYLGGAPQASPELAADIPLELRLMRPEDTAGLARCAYRCYGFSYVRDTIYRPEMFEALLRQGLIVSAVAVTPDGELVAHVAISRHSAEEKIADSGQAITDPRIRGRNLFTSLKQMLAEEARRLGLYGLYSESVTIHPFTQKANLKLGATETALMLGFAPATVSFRQIADLPTRSAAMVTYLQVNEEPQRTVFLPSRHAEILKEIYARLGLRRELRFDDAPLSQSTVADVTMVPELVASYVHVQRAGSDLAGLGRRRDGEVVYLDLPLSRATTPRACALLEGEGFHLAGLIPEACPEGDVLRLQRLHSEMQPPETIHAASEWGARLKDYVLAQRAEG